MMGEGSDRSVEESEKTEDARRRRRERRRRKAERETEGNSSALGSGKTIENEESASGGDGGRCSGGLVRRDTYTVLQPKVDPEELSCGDDSSEWRNIGESVGGQSCGTYNVESSGERVRPVPAPRKRKSVVSSDTERDVTEIDLDELREKSPEGGWGGGEVGGGGESEGVKAPVPKPRWSLRGLERGDGGSVEGSRSVCEGLEGGGGGEGERKSTGALLELRGRRSKAKRFSSLMRLERKKMPKISSILRELKEEGGREVRGGVEEERVDFQIDCPALTAENGEIYVQRKNGFRVMERSEILRSGNEKAEREGNGGMLEDSTVRTAILFQKYWSRSMIYFHGVLAGFGFSHAATVTAIMLHHNYDPHGFIGVYSCLSLKIHYVFYTLTALCIVSCFDRVDIGHMNRRHWQTAWKAPSMWVILCVYVVSFVLTFSNQVTEARFDAQGSANASELWKTESQSEVQVGLLQWYHTVWARDVLVLVAWLMISLTNFSDFLHSHISNMAKYAETKEAERSLDHSAGSKGDFL